MRSVREQCLGCGDVRTDDHVCSRDLYRALHSLYVALVDEHEAQNAHQRN